jgi:hypothetical protein
MFDWALHCIDVVDSLKYGSEKESSPKSHDLQRQRQYFRIANRNFPLL